MPLSYFGTTSGLNQGRLAKGKPLVTPTHLLDSHNSTVIGKTANLILQQCAFGYAQVITHVHIDATFSHRLYPEWPVCITPSCARNVLHFGGMNFSGLNSPTVLIVEDDPVSRRILDRNLSRLMCTVLQANDGVEAWLILQREPVRIVISDWMMPQMDGLELCRRVRERDDNNYTYFILLTARQGDDSYREAMAAGVDDFLAKPLDRRELMNRVLVAKRIIKFATQARQLKMLLPICMYCKKIRNDNDYWEKIDEYIHQNTGTDFSHGVCPDCYKKTAAPEMAASLRELSEAQGLKPEP